MSTLKEKAIELKEIFDCMDCSVCPIRNACDDLEGAEGRTICQYLMKTYSEIK